MIRRIPAKPNLHLIGQRISLSLSLSLSLFLSPVRRWHATISSYGRQQTDGGTTQLRRLRPESRPLILVRSGRSVLIGREEGARAAAALGRVRPPAIPISAHPSLMTIQESILYTFLMPH